jgi:hypothetical protein
MFIINLQKYVNKSVIMLGFLWLGGCSTLQLAYSQAPSLLYWWIDGYIDFSKEQAPAVRSALAELHSWHRSSELPKTIAVLQKAQALLPGNVTAPQACGIFDAVRGLTSAITEHALPGIADFSANVTAQQLEKLQRKYQKNNDEFNRDFIQAKPEERKAKRMKGAIERSERIYGKLGDAQLQAIDAAIDSSSFDATMALKEAERRQKDALDTLRHISLTKPEPNAAQTALRAYLERSLKSPDLTYRQYAAKLVQESCESFATVHASTTPAQRAKAVQTLKGYEGDLLAASGQK